MSESSREDDVIDEARSGGNAKGIGPRRQSARPSSEVAEVANRPKKRPGSRLRSSITTRRRAMLV